jgi:hypothetical protein
MACLRCHAPACLANCRKKEVNMKLAMIVMLGSILATMGACQSDMAGPLKSAPNSAAGISPEQMHQNVEHGDVYLEEAIGRYDLDKG